MVPEHIPPADRMHHEAGFTGPAQPVYEPPGPQYQAFWTLSPGYTMMRGNPEFGAPHLILHGTHATGVSRVQRNSVPSTQMRCMITANLRARATIAFFIPRRLAICIAQALSQDHFFDHSML